MSDEYDWENDDILDQYKDWIAEVAAYAPKGFLFCKELEQQLEQAFFKGVHPHQAKEILEKFGK